MERKCIMTENSLHQPQELGVDIYDDHIEIAKLLSEEIEILDMIDGKPVTVIGELFFNYGR